MIRGRRECAGLLSTLILLLGHTGSAIAQSSGTHQTLPVDPEMGIQTLPLWPGQSQPESTLTVFLPQPGKGNGTGVIVIPGGAYIGLAINLEGRQVADWFAARGVTAFVLRYRLGPQHPYPEPLLDAQRAIRLVRSMSEQYKLSPDRIGVVGFSAGGHLAAMAATSFRETDATATDPVDRFSDRPDFLVLGYPWLNAMQPNSRGMITYCSMMPTTPPEKCRQWEQEYTPALHVSARTPSTFIYSTTDDKTVPVSASVDFYNALLSAGVPAEMHLFRHGGHGSGLGSGDPALDAWPMLLELWLRGQGWLPENGTSTPGTAVR